MAALVAAAETVELGSVWMGDPPAGDPDALDPLTALAALARTSSRLRLGAMPLHVAVRPPGVLAKALSTLDVLSGGRLTVGLAPRHDGVDGADELREVLAIIRAAFTGQPVNRAGRFHRVAGLTGLPRPVQRPGPPLWVVGRSGPMLALAAAEGDGWSPGAWDLSLDEFAADVTRLDDLCRRADRDPATLARSANLHLPAVDRTDLGRWAAAGLSHVVVGPGALPFSEMRTDDLALLASATR